MKKYDIAIIGGGPAGLSAALTAGRGNRSVIVFDDNRPRNAPAQHMMNFPSRDGTPPSSFKEQIKHDLKRYPKVEFLDSKVEAITPVDGIFRVDQILASKVLLAHGVRDMLPPYPGIEELFGKSIFHCPYCHGYEYLQDPMGLVASGDFALHLAPVIRGLSEDFVLFTDGHEAPAIPGIRIYTSKITSLLQQDSQLKAIQLEDGEIIERKYLYIKPERKFSCDLGEKAGCEVNEFGLYKVNELGLTTRPGIYAAGDIATQMQSVLMACALGQKAGAAINAEIMHERQLRNEL